MEYTCRVVESRSLTPSVFHLTFTPDRELDFKAGQYISVVVPQDGKPLRRPYSIASAPNVSPIELCIQRIEHGPGNTYLQNLKVGETFHGFAPYGFLLYHPKPHRDAIFLSTGTGLAPFRSMVLSKEYQDEPPRKATCLLGVRDEKEILYADDMSQVAGLEWVPCLSRVDQCAPGHFKGRVTQYLYEHAKQIAWHETDFYLCGNGAMIDEVKKLLKDKGVGKEAIYQEIYFKPPKTA